MSSRRTREEILSAMEEIRRATQGVTGVDEEIRRLRDGERVMRELKADDLEPGNGFEVVVKEDGFHLQFFYDWAKRKKGYDGEGVGVTFSTAAISAIRDAEGEDEE